MLIFIHKVTLANSLRLHHLIALDFSPEDFNSIQHSCSVLVEEHTELWFSEVVQWDINALATDFSAWVTVDSVHPAATSRVGILSSAECQGLLRIYLNDDLCSNLGLLVKISSLLYSGNEPPHPYIDRERLILMRSLVGARLLKSLETFLKSSILTKASKEQLTGLFLVLLGVIIAVSYTVTTSTEEARCELSRILAHHMVVIGERIGLLNHDVKKQQLIEDCHNLWKKTGNFEWDYRKSMVVEGMDINESLEENSPTGVCGNMNKFYHHLDDTTDVATIVNKAHQDDPIRNTKQQMAVYPQADCFWADNDGADQISSPTAREMTICFLCNGNFPSDEMCPTCFGSLPEIGGYSDENPQCDFASTSSIPSSQPNDFVAEGLNTGLQKVESTDGCFRRLKRHLRPRIPKKFIPAENKYDSGSSNVHLQAPQLKQPIQFYKPTMEKQNTAREPVMHLKKRGQCCPIVDPNADLGSRIECLYMRCLWCRIEDPHPSSRGLIVLACCQCQYSPQSLWSQRCSGLV